MSTPFWDNDCRIEMTMANAVGLRKIEVTPSIHKAKRDLEECEISEGYMIGGYHIAFVYSVVSRIVDCLFELLLKQGLEFGPFVSHQLEL